MKIVLFSGKDISSDIVYSHLNSNYNLTTVIVDSPVSKIKLIKRRIKKNGYIDVFLQLLFMKFITPILKIESKKRQAKILEGMKIKPISDFKHTIYSSSINSNKVINLVKNINPDLIVVNGTRIINKRTIDSINIPMINIHVGITPIYRGVHGGYWALVNNDSENCGVTVHRIDTGIDTGSILSQKKIVISGNDNFVTYPLLQIKEGLNCLDDAISQFNNNKFKTYKKILKNKLYYHPKINTYLFNRFFKGIK